MAGTLRDDLASLKIERGSRGQTASAPQPGRRNSGDRGIGLIAVVLWLIPLGLIGFAATYAYKQYDQIRSKPEVTVGLVQTMTTGEAEKLLSAKGYLKARHQASVGSKMLGRVVKILVEEGSRVNEGDLLGELDHKELDFRLKSLEATAKKTEAELSEAQVDLKEKEREAARARRLYLARTVSIEDAEKAESIRGMAAARVEAIQAALALAKANVHETEENIHNMSLFAPFKGTVVKKECEVGDILTPAAFSNLGIKAYLVQLASLDDMEVETDVAENLLSRIAPGQPAEVSVSAVPDRHYRGTLRQVIPMSDRSRGTVKVNVKILDPDEKLFPELVATVHFLPDKAKSNAGPDKSYTFVPKSAVFEANGHTYAWVVGEKSRVTRRQVEVALTTDELGRVESGLKAGEMVVVNPAKTLRENETVKVAE
jgi:RND family efflux transporter MFP subunit